MYIYIENKKISSKFSLSLYAPVLTIHELEQRMFHYDIEFDFKR
jgi:hypothetical protein